VQRPDLHDAEALLKIRVASVNFADTLRRGAYLTQARLPEVPGFQASGLKLPLADAAEAHRRIEARSTAGKILLMVA
jgi:NADPH:quinone reductase-like Zn-dependent oxidoreductase